MMLKGAQKEILCQALTEHFQEKALKRLICFKIDEIELTDVGGENYADFVFNLVQLACAQGCHTKLIQVIYAERPSCKKLTILLEELRIPARLNPVSDIQSSRTIEVCDFDLVLPTRKAVSYLDEKRGLVGFSIPCAEVQFRVRFCERLRKRLGRNKLIPKDPIKMDYKTSVDAVFRRIQRHEKALKNGRDILCPVELASSEASSQMADELWSQLSNHFGALELSNRLIIFFYSQDRDSVPTGVYQIEPPEFDEMDVRDWVYDIAERQNWKDSTWRSWKELMVEHASQGEQSTALDIYNVYEHLDFSIGLLQNKLSEQDFLKQLALGPY